MEPEIPPDLTEVDMLNFIKAFWRAEPSCLQLQCNDDCSPASASCGRMDEVAKAHNARQDTK